MGEAGRRRRVRVKGTNEKWKTRCNSRSVLLGRCSALKSWKQCSGYFYIHYSWSCLVFCCIWKRVFYFKPLNIRLRKPGLRALIRAFHAYFITFKLPWNQWSVAARFPLNFLPCRGAQRSLPKAVSFPEVPSHTSLSATMATSIGGQRAGNGGLKCTGKFWWLNNLMIWFV